jgi:hypothetical protein
MMAAEAPGAGASLLTRAAVLSVFDVSWLNADDITTSDDEVIDFLTGSCERVMDPTGTPRWQLRDEQRGRVLRSAGRTALRTALDHLSHRPDDAVQAALERFIGGTPASAEQLDASALRGQLQLERWIGGADAPGDLQARLDWLTVTDPLRRLLAHGFYGRQGTLRECREFINGSEERPLVPFERRDHPAESHPPLLPFLIAGVGGSGKSSVLARLILEQRDDADMTAYLSFDRGWLLDGGPVAIFDELLRQLGAQWAGCRPAVADIRRRLRGPTGMSSPAGDIASRAAQSVQAVDPDLIGVLSRALSGRHRVVVLLDTLEELARRDQALADEVYSFLLSLSRVIPSVRVIAAGRALPWTAAQAHRVLGLAGLDEADALDLMRSLTVGARVTEGVLREIITLVRGNPLSLHLAAGVLNRTGDDPSWMIAVTEDNVQGQLYSRLLDHIRDPEVRAVAHPGLVVRRLTPGVIKMVLAEPCGIAPLDDTAAARVFAGLREEATLCEPSPDGDGALMHRQDVRAIMLPAITRDSPGTTREIHEAAVGYYWTAGTVPGDEHVSRREELYHRLMLGQDRETLDRRWEQAVAAELTTVIDEFPASSQLYLHTKVQGLRVNAALRMSATDFEWQQVTRPAVLRYMERGQASGALALIRERRGPDGGSLLPEEEIEALERLDRLPEALHLSRRTREEAERRGEVTQLRGLIVSEARILERMRRWATAWDLLVGLAGLDRARRARPEPPLDDDLRIQHLVILTSMLRIARNERRLTERLRTFAITLRLRFRWYHVPHRPVADLTAETVSLAESTPQRVLAAQPSLLRDLAAEIGEKSGDVLALAQTTLGGLDGPSTASAVVTATAVAVTPVIPLIGSFFLVLREAVRLLLVRRRARKSAQQSARTFRSASDASQDYMSTEDLVASHLLLRVSIGTIAVLLPYVLVLGNWITGHAVPPSLSGFYYSPMRNIFVCAFGVLGAFLLVYRGYNLADRILTNVAGISAIGIALFPIAPAYRPSSAQVTAGYVHLGFWSLMLITLALMALRFANPVPAPPGLTSWERLNYELGFSGSGRPSGRMSAWEAAVYRTCGILILACVVATYPGAALSSTGYVLLVLETVALVAVGVSWLIKGRTVLSGIESSSETITFN